MYVLLTLLLQAPLSEETITDELNEEAEASSAQRTDEDEEVPFNLDSLRKHLAEVAYARRLLPTDALTHQKLLEASVYDEAAKRMQRDSEKLDELGLGSKGLKQEQLQIWMFEWHKKLVKKLQAEIEEVKRQEDACRCF